MAQEFQIKGSTLRSKLEFAEDRLGPEARRGLEEYLRKHGVGTVLDASWYPFALYDGLLHELAESFFGGDVSRLEEVGAHSAETALSTTYAPFAARGDFPRFLRRLSNLHGQLYNAGRLVITATGDGFCELELREVPEISRADSHLAAGFYAGAARWMGLERVRCRFTIDGDRVRYRLDWS